VFADGLRNEVGLTFDPQGRLWGVENGSDDLSRADLGGDIHNDNPAEEMNLFAEPGRFYGYPYCWSEHTLAAGRGAGTQWAYRSGDPTHGDAWCQDPANNLPPKFSLPAHVAPLDIIFYDGAAFPAWNGDAIVTLHGSWNRSMAAGYKVVRVGFRDGNPVAMEPLLTYVGPGDKAGGWSHRPVGVRQGPDGTLYVSSDASGVVIAIGQAP
jgi:glucose/arabinose dehydrogenase